MDEEGTISGHHLSLAGDRVFFQGGGQGTHPAVDLLIYLVAKLYHSAASPASRKRGSLCMELPQETDPVLVTQLSVMIILYHKSGQFPIPNYITNKLVFTQSG